SMTAKQRFKVVLFENPRTGTKSYRVTGTKRDGSRIRENFTDEHSAKCRHLDLEKEWLDRESETGLRATKLTDIQIHIAELAFRRLEHDEELSKAVEHWLRKGKQEAAAIATESPRIDDAVTKFKGWLDGEGDGTGNGHCTL